MNDDDDEYIDVAGLQYANSYLVFVTMWD